MQKWPLHTTQTQYAESYYGDKDHLVRFRPELTRTGKTASCTVRMSWYSTTLAFTRNKENSVLCSCATFFQRSGSRKLHFLHAVT